MTKLSRLLALAPALLAAALVAACGDYDGSRAAPDFSLRGPDGRAVSLSSQKGRVVLINFWATWCGSCREELPALQELQRRRGGDRFTLLAVSVDVDAAQAVPSFLSRHRLDFPVLYADTATAGAYAVRSLPTSYLIGPDGQIARRYLGPLDVDAVENDILALLRRPS